MKNSNEDHWMVLVEPHDVLVIEHLIYITITLHQQNYGFFLNVPFKKNPLFNNQVLTKEYIWGISQI